MNILQKQAPHHAQNARKVNIKKMKVKLRVVIAQLITFHMEEQLTVTNALLAHIQLKVHLHALYARKVKYRPKAKHVLPVAVVN